MQTLWYGEDNMEVFHRGQIGSQLIHPLKFPGVLALRTMAIATRVIRVPGIPAMVTTIRVSAQSGSAAVYDGTECF